MAARSHEPVRSADRQSAADKKVEIFMLRWGVNMRRIRHEQGRIRGVRSGIRHCDDRQRRVLTAHERRDAYLGES
jgi:hypothetical protein